MNRQPIDEDDDTMLPEYDFSGGVRGKYHRAYHEGHTVIIRHADGTTDVEEHLPGPGTVVLDRDVLAYFPDSESVNRALRALIGILPEKRSA